MSGVGSTGRPSAVARVVIRRVRSVAVLGLVLAGIAMALVPGPMTYDAAWLAGLPARWTSLPPDVLAGAAVVVSVLTVLASVRLRATGWVRLLVVLLVGVTVGAPAFGLAGGPLVVSVAVVLSGVACWVAAGMFRTARSVP